ncbi:MAG: hypothetical protein ACKOPE_11295 [Novosphingobium sp.]
MNDPQDLDPAEQRKRIIVGRNRALALVLFGLVVLFFAITIVKMK